MEWLDGEGLVQRLDRGTLSVEETLDLGRRIATALSVAHARGVIHRDLKPGNLFLPGKELSRVMILDFGIARAVSGGQSLTSTGATLGSPGYLSPEQARGDKNVDTRADVFSLACVLFRCLTGRPPFTGDLIQVMMQTVLEPAPLAGSLREGIPPAVEDLIQRMLAKSPDARPRDAAAVAAELTALAPSAPRAIPRTTGAHGTMALSSMLEPPSPVAPRPLSSPPSAAAPQPSASWSAAAAPQPSASWSVPSAPAPSFPAPYPHAAPSAPPPPYTAAPPSAAPSLAQPSLPGAPGSRPSAVPPLSANAPAAPRPSRTRVWIFVVVGVLVLGGGAVGAFFAFGDELFHKASPAAAPAGKRKAR
jgi:serine/threonine protein kinase